MEKREIIDGMVSIIMPSFNCEQYIAETIESVLKQTCKNWELLIIDDGSSDRTPAIAAEYAEKYPEIFLLHSKAPGSGPARARNIGLKAARGEFVAFLDSDDLWYPEKLHKQLVCMQQNGWHAMASGYRQIDAEGRSTGNYYMPPQRTGYWKCYFLSNPIGNSTVIYSRRAIGELTIPDIRKRNDFALWLKLLKKEKYIYGMQEIVASYRVREHSVSQNKQSLIKYHWILYRKIEKHSLLVSCLGMMTWVLVKGTGIRVKHEDK